MINERRNYGRSNIFYNIIRNDSIIIVFSVERKIDKALRIQNYIHNVADNGDKAYYPIQHSASRRILIQHCDTVLYADNLGGRSNNLSAVSGGKVHISE